MANSILGTGISGLGAAQIGLTTTGHNIANAATPGYTRQRAVQATNLAQFTGAGFLGQGVHVASVERVYSQFLANQVLQVQSESAELDSQYAQIQQIDRMLADPAAGLSPALQDFFRGVQEVGAHPASMPARQAMLSSAESLAARFNTLDERLVEMRDSVDSQITASIAQVNSFAQQIAHLNHSIIVSESSGASNNDLRDQRDALVADLNRELRATVVSQDDGAYNVFVGNGQPLVIGTQAFSLAVVPSNTDPMRMTVAYQSPAGAIPLQESSLAGGNLGGYFAFRSETLDSAQNALGRIAIALAQSFNEQHRLGQDLNSALGGDFFRVGAPLASAGSANTGNAVISATLSNYAALTASDYGLRYDGANYTLTRLADGTQQTFATFPQTVDGFTLTLASGAAAAGDEFLIRPSINGARDIAVAFRDPAQIAAAAPIRTAAPLSNTGSGVVSAGEVNAPPPPNANLLQPVTITFTSPTTFDVTGTGTGNPTGLAYTPGASISYNGWTIQVSGSPAAGDVFTVGANSGGVADNRNALRLAALQTQRIVEGNSTLQSAYSAIVSQVGNRTRQLEIEAKAQATLLEQTVQAQQSVSGVNLDEEAANLLRYQQAYQAAGKVIAIASTLFNTVLELGD